MVGFTVIRPPPRLPSIWGEEEAMAPLGVEGPSRLAVPPPARAGPGPCARRDCSDLGWQATGRPSSRAWEGPVGLPMSQA